MCSRCASPFPSSEGICKKCLLQKTMKNRLRQFLVIFPLVAFFVALLCACAGLLARHYLYTSYQPAQCTIIDKRTVSDYVNSDTWYQPSLTYNVTRSDGYQETVTGYKGPWFDGWADRYVVPDASESILQHYSIGETYPCWYTPFRSTHAVLVLTDYSSGAMSFSFWMTVFFGFLVWWIALVIFSATKEFFILSKRGIATQGIVLSVEQHLVAGKSHTLTTTEFQTRTDPPVYYQTTGNGMLIPPTIGAMVGVVYDPKNPAENALIGHRWAPMIFFLLFSLLGLVFLTLIFLLMYVIWLL